MKSQITSIEERNSDSAINMVLDTILIKKQCIVFVNTKRSAESLAEKVSQIIAKDKKHDYKAFIDLKNLEGLSSQILKVLSTPTKQCNRLADLVRYGIAFHHSGLVSEQRKLIEENFRQGTIKIIVATPTLAMGVDLPAFRVIIRDLKRYGLWGLQYIPVLEYEQQAGRAGRPSYDSYGEAICIAENNSEQSEIKERYIDGVPEPIVSKLAVEPIMRTYILSLIASEFIKTDRELEEFFQETFYAMHYGDTQKLKQIIYRMVEQLEEWGFIQIDNKVKAPPDPMKDFVSALKYSFRNPDEKISATLLGKRISELYLDPYTAHQIIEALNLALLRKEEDRLTAYSIIHLVCSSLELRPLLRVKSREMDDIKECVNKNEDYLLTQAPEMFDEYYEEFLNTIKTAEFFMEWLDEKDEEYLLEKYDVRPGELHSKKEIADWLLYSGEEISKLLKMHVLVKDLAKLRFRLKYGAKEELIPLLQLKNIGRIRARKMFDNRIRDIGDVKKADFVLLSQLLGKTVALDIKRQVGQELSEDKIKTPENKRKGQINLDDY
ncbi:MAG: helicase-related protein [Candidatus Woesearchaeota archaeon]